MNVGIDLGYSSVKLVSDQRRKSFPSVVGTEEQSNFSLGEIEDRILLTSPEHVLIGETAITQSRFVNRREDRAWIESKAYYHLFLAALTELTTATVVRMFVVTGLPVAFFSDRATIRDKLEGIHAVKRDGHRAQTFKVSECRVIPQPFGALLAAALDHHGRIADQDLATGTVGVIDVGGKTTNLLSVTRLAEIGRETDSISVGVWDVVRAARSFLANRCPDLELRDHQLVNAVVAGQVRYYGELVDLKPAIEAALGPMANQVFGQASQLWKGGARLDAILVAGGGALLLEPYLKARFSHARVVSEPVFANAVGYWKLAQRLSSGSN